MVIWLSFLNMYFPDAGLSTRKQNTKMYHGFTYE